MHVSHLDIVGHNAHSDTDNKSNVGLVCTGKTFFQPLWQSTHWKVLDTVAFASCMRHFAYGSRYLVIRLASQKKNTTAS